MSLEFPPLLAAPVSASLTLLAYSVITVFASLLGGILPSLIRLTHTRLQLIISLIGGLMLGVGLLHQLPHAVAIEPVGNDGANLDFCLLWMLGGLIAMFLLLRWAHFHRHDAPEVVVPDQPANSSATLPATTAGRDPTHQHTHDHDHDHPRGHEHGLAHGHHHGHGHADDRSAHPTSWIGVALGLSLHTLFDGIALAAAVQAEQLHHHTGLLLGFGTFVGIALHKPLDSLSITSLMLAGGWTARARHTMNFAYAMMCPLGALLFSWGLSQGGESQAMWVGAALAFSAGLFVCIALSDLLPEIDFHSHDRLALSIALLIGVFLAWGIGMLEPPHSHTDGQHHAHHHGDHDSANSEAHSPAAGSGRRIRVQVHRD